MRLQEKMDKEGGANPVDMDIVRHVYVITAAVSVT